MAGIELLSKPGGDIAVYLDSRRAGTIIRAPGGYAYVPTGQKRSQHGEVFESVVLVVESLKGDD